MTAVRLTFSLKVATFLCLWAVSLGKSCPCKAFSPEDGKNLNMFTNSGLSSKLKLNFRAVNVLLEFKKGITLDPYGALSDWKVTLSCANGWFGVNCDSSSRVTTLSVKNYPVPKRSSILANLSFLCYYFPETLATIL